MSTEAICEHCASECDDTEISKCQQCGHDGLGPCCILPDDHSCPPKDERVLPSCACGAVATCFGLYESDEEEDWAYACDACCGHGNEDGTCESIADLGSLWRVASVRLSNLESDLDRAQRRIQTLKSKVDFYKAKAERATKAVP